MASPQTDFAAGEAERFPLALCRALLKAIEEDD